MILIQIDDRYENTELDSADIEELVKTVCKQFKVENATVSIAIVGDLEIRNINKSFLDRDSNTDCISFDLSDDDQVLYDMMVNAEMAEQQGHKRGHSPRAELALYIAHGLLHNLGFDDQTADDAKKMHETEDRILKELGYGSVYESS